MFCCHSDSRRAMILASLSGCAAIPMRQSRRSRAHPAPLPNQHAVAGWFHLEPPGRADTVGADDVPHPAALIFDLDDLAHRLPVAERVVLVASAEAGADLDAVGVVEPFDVLQLRRASRGQGDVGDVFPRGGDIARERAGSLLTWADHGNAPLQHAKDARRSERNDRKARARYEGRRDDRAPDAGRGRVRCGGRADRCRFAVGARSVGLRRADGTGVRCGQDVDDQARNVCGATGFAQSRAAGHVRVEPAGAVGRQIPLGCRHVGAAGDGGLARCPVPQAGGDDKGNHRDRPDRQPRRPARASR